MTDFDIQNSNALRKVNTIFADCMAHSAMMAQQLNAATQAMQEKRQRLENEKAMRERANVESLSRLVEELTRQNEFLKAQAKSDKKWKWVATIIGVIGTIGSIFGIIF